MRLYRLENLCGLDALKLTNAPDPRPGAREVVVRIHACSLNHRDLNIISGGYTSHAIKPAVIPLSDGAGEVTAIADEERAERADQQRVERQVEGAAHRPEAVFIAGEGGVRAIRDDAQGERH